MATKTVTTMVCDLTGEEGPDVEEVQFGLNGVTYLIDLSAPKAAELAGFMATYVEHGRRLGRASVGSPPRRLPSRASAPESDLSREERAEIRAWALPLKACGDRGRIPVEVIVAYHNGKDVGAVHAYLERKGRLQRVA